MRSKELRIGKIAGMKANRWPAPALSGRTLPKLWVFRKAGTAATVCGTVRYIMDQHIKRDWETGAIRGDKSWAIVWK